VRVHPRASASIDEQFQGQESGGLRVIRQQAVQHPRRPDRLLGQLQALRVGPVGARVALVEHQVQHPQDIHERTCTRGIDVPSDFRGQDFTLDKSL